MVFKKLFKVCLCQREKVSDCRVFGEMLFREYRLKCVFIKKNLRSRSLAFKVFIEY